MLTHAHISDFAIIESLELDFDRGLTCLTGETGAGKSILVDALGLALGDRADATTVRHGADRAEISIGFDLADQPQVSEWLAENELDDDSGECLVRRTITSEGRSKAWINGRAVPIQMLKELGDSLVDIHGQHEHQSLMRRDAQRELLDAFAGHGGLLAELGEAHGEWRTTRQKLDQLRDSQQENDDRRDLLRFQVGELDALALTAEELPELENEHHRLAHASKLVEGTQAALVEAYENDDGSAYSLLADAVEKLGELVDYDESLKPVAETLNSALINLQEGAEELRRYVGNLDMDPDRRDEVESRLASIQELARKHRVNSDELPGLADKLREELDGLENADERIAELEKQVSQCEKRYLELAGKLRTSRQKVAGKLGKDVTAVMQELGMSGGRFDIAVEDDPKGRYAAHGRDAIEFRVSANPGQPPKPLAKVASGGELSRISLAIQVIASNASNMPVMIFDEVDAGVGGGIAELIGRRMRDLGQGDGKQRQVFCVTHLPQVASQAHHHFKVEKTAGKDATHTGIRKLDDAARVEELARMLGGVNITDTTLEHAREMIRAAS